MVDLLSDESFGSDDLPMPGAFSFGKKKVEPEVEEEEEMKTEQLEENPEINIKEIGRYWDEDFTLTKNEAG